jgi:hypothetical protein
VKPHKPNVDINSKADKAQPLNKAIKNKIAAKMLKKGIDIEEIKRTLNCDIQLSLETDKLKTLVFMRL